MRHEPDPTLIILRNPQLQRLPPEVKEELAARISQLKDVDLDAELEELDRRIGHYSWCLNMLGNRFRWRWDYYVKRNVWGNRGDGPCHPMDQLLYRMRATPFEYVSDYDQDVVRAVGKLYFDELERLREEDKKITIEERWANATTYTLYDD